jgi:hypothetical protein
MEIIPWQNKGTFLMISTLVILLFGHALPSTEALSFRDADHYHVPIKKQIADSFRSGQLPLWNESVGCGVPFLADPNSQVFYPANLLLLLTSPAQSVKYFVIGHFVLGVLALSLLALEIGVGAPAALFGGLVFMGSGAVISQHWNLLWMAGLPWFLVSMVFVRRLLYRGGSWQGAVVLVFSSTLMVLAGAFELLLAFGVYSFAELAAVWLSLRGNQERLRSVVRDSVLLGISGILAVGVAACQLLPTYELVSLSFRCSIQVPLQTNRFWGVSTLEFR